MRNILLGLSLALIASCSTQKKEKPKEKTPDVVVVGPDRPGSVAWKVPPRNSNFQIMDEEDGDYVSQLFPDTKVVNVELFGTDLKRNTALKAKGVYVVCYYSLSYEGWRPDAKQFPKPAIGKKMDGWDENWTDLRSEPLQLFMDKRDDLAKERGCDATEKDNSDDGEKAFRMTRADLVWSSKRRADYAHSIGLGSIFKNTPDIAKEAAEHNDGIFIEEANKYDEVESYAPWANKFAGFVEYSKSKAKCLNWAVVNYHKSGYFTGKYSKCE